MVDFMILYEIPTRELESALILGNELQSRGYSVEYTSFYDVTKDNYYLNRKKLKRYRNNVRVLLVPSFYHNNELLDMFYLPFGKVEKIVNLRWEQYFVNEIMDDPKGHLYLYPCEKGKDAFHVCWGNVSHRNMVDAGIHEDRLLDTGPLHMDILRDEFRGYYKSKEELFNLYQLDSKKKAVLFISSFANATDKTTYHQYLNKFFSGNYQVDYSRIDMERASYDLALEWFDEFMKAHPDVVFVYRPHPSEFITERLKSIEEKHPNFRVISMEHSVKQWILSCETIVTWMSTAIVEAYFAGKPCFIIRPVRFPVEKDMCLYKNARFISDKTEFMGITDAVCENALSDKYVHQCYDVQKEAPAYIRLCDALEQIIKTSKKFPWDKKMLRKYDRKKLVLVINNLRKRAKSKIRSFAIKILQGIKKHTCISFGKRIDNKLSVREINSRRDYYSLGFDEKNKALGDIVRKQRELRNNSHETAI